MTKKRRRLQWIEVNTKRGTAGSLEEKSGCGKGESVHVEHSREDYGLQAGVRWASK